MAERQTSSSDQRKQIILSDHQQLVDWQLKVDLGRKLSFTEDVVRHARDDFT